MTKKRGRKPSMFNVSASDEVQDARSPSAPLRDSTDFIVVHCTATRKGQDIGLADVDRWHCAKGWDGCGYHEIIRLDGTVEFGREVGAIGAHAYGYNRRSLGIALVGGLNRMGTPANTYTELQLRALKDRLEHHLGNYPAAEVVGHRDLSPDIDGDGVIERWEWLKECPCMDVRAWVVRWGVAYAATESEPVEDEPEPPTVNLSSPEDDEPSLSPME
jgi:N-acetyl-anhydromuramyl-L-alanine amidase AmpD